MSESPGLWRRSGVDLRLLLMCALLAIMAIVFHWLSGGIFLTPENLYNIAQQTAVVGIVSTVMVLVIVARHIDLSVGSVMGFVGVLVAYLQYTSGWSWPASCLAGLAGSPRCWACPPSWSRWVG
jgi:D-xylose transport system permease protein